MDGQPFFGQSKRSFFDIGGDLADSQSDKRLNSGQHSSQTRVNFHQEPPPAEGSADLTMEVVFRILCPAAKVGAVIGVGGSVIRDLRDQSGARIKIADAVSGVDERVIIVSAAEEEGVEWCAAQEGGGGGMGRWHRDSRVSGLRSQV